MRCWVTIAALTVSLHVSRSWIPPLAATARRRATIRRRAREGRLVTPCSSTLKQTLLAAQPSSSSENFGSNSNGNPSSPFRAAAAAVAAQRRRLQVAGVSVSSTGFYVILQANASHYLPLRVTDDAMDESSATSPQALTILQLLARVDMAGAILPPDTLAKIVVLTLEEEMDQQQEDFGDIAVQDTSSTLASSTPVGSAVLAVVQERLNKLDYTNATTYSELLEYPWLQSRVSLPMATLDELILSPQASGSSATAAAVKSYTLVCSVKNLKVGSSISVELTESVCASVSYEYRPNGVSLAFVAVALALRYRSPIVLALTDDFDRDAGSELSSFKLFTLDEIRKEFPLYRTAAQLQQTTERVTSNIEKGLKVNQLQAALRIALQKEDFAAATKIRRALDEMDSMSDLPTQAESDTDSMQ